MWGPRMSFWATWSEEERGLRAVGPRKNAYLEAHWLGSARNPLGWNAIGLPITQLDFRWGP